MTLKTRRMLLYTSILVFIISTPLLILYAQGYRYDFEEKKIVKTGGIFIKLDPADAKITLNNKIVTTKRYSLFNSGHLIKNLVPGKYDISASKDGYYDWNKNTTVDAEVINEFKNVTLWPKELKSSILLNLKNGKISDFFVNDNKIFYLKNSASGEFFGIKTEDAQKEIFLQNMSGIRIISIKNNNALIKDRNNNWALLYEDKEFIRQTSLNKLTLYFTKAIQNTEATTTTISRNLENIGTAAFYGNKNILILDSKNIYTYEIIAKNLKSTPFRNISWFKIFDDDIIYSAEDGSIFLSNVSKSEENILLSKSSLLPIKNQEPEIHKSNKEKYIFLLKNLYIFDKKTQSAKKIDENIYNIISVSPDGKKLAYIKNRRLFIYYLENSEAPLYHNAEEKYEIAALTFNPEFIYWIEKNGNYEHVLLGNKNTASIYETDNRDIANYASWNIKSGKSFFEISKNILYILDGPNIYSINF